jgi:hypothetical protein
MPDAAVGEQLSQRAVLDVGEGVVGHQSPRRDAVAFEVGERPLDEAGHRLRGLVVVALDESQPRMVVGDRVDAVVADPCFRAHPPAGALRAVTGDPVAGPPETRIARDVHMQQITGAGPLVPIRRLGHRSWPARQPVAAKDLPDRRVGEAGHPRDQPWPPTGLTSAGADRLLPLGRQKPRRASRPARAVKQRLHSAATVQPAMPPPMRRRRRDAEGGRGRLQRKTILNRPDQGKPPGHSSLALACRYIRALLRE